MAKGTAIFLFILAIIATLLIGINIGKKIQLAQTTVPPTPSPISSPPATPTLFQPTIDLQGKKTSLTSYTDEACGFSFSYPGSYLQQKTVNGTTTIFTHPDDEREYIVATCAWEIPKPPLPPEKMEKVTLDGTSATLYHDVASNDGSPRDEVIVKHPTNGKEIILAGFGPTFQSALSSFKFVR